MKSSTEERVILVRHPRLNPAGRFIIFILILFLAVIWMHATNAFQFYGTTDPAWYARVPCSTRQLVAGINGLTFLMAGILIHQFDGLLKSSLREGA